MLQAEQMRYCSQTTSEIFVRRNNPLFWFGPQTLNFFKNRRFHQYTNGNLPSRFLLTPWKGDCRAVSAFSSEFVVTWKESCTSYIRAYK